MYRVKYNVVASNERKVNLRKLNELRIRKAFNLITTQLVCFCKLFQQQEFAGLDCKTRFLSITNEISPHGKIVYMCKSFCHYCNQLHHDENFI